MKKPRNLSANFGGLYKPMSGKMMQRRMTTDDNKAPLKPPKKTSKIPFNLQIRNKSVRNPSTHITYYKNKNLDSLITCSKKTLE